MATLEEFKALRDGVPAEMQAALYRLTLQILKRPSADGGDCGRRGMTPTVEEVKRASSSRWMRTMSLI